MRMMLLSFPLLLLLLPIHNVLIVLVRICNHKAEPERRRRRRMQEQLLALPAMPYGTVRLTIVGKGRVGKSSLLRGIANGLSDSMQV